MEKESFLIYKSFYEPVKLLSNEQLGRLFRGLFEYQLLGKEITDNDLFMAFSFFKNQFLLDDYKYQKIIIKRSAAGKIGMERRWNDVITTITNDKDDTKSITNDIINITPITPITNITDNDNEKENEKENEKVNDKKNSKSKTLKIFDAVNFNLIAEQEKWTPEEKHNNLVKAIREFEKEEGATIYAPPKLESKPLPDELPIFDEIIDFFGLKDKNKFEDKHLDLMRIISQLNLNNQLDDFTNQCRSYIRQTHNPQYRMNFSKFITDGWKQEDWVDKEKKIKEAILNGQNNQSENERPMPRLIPSIAYPNDPKY